MRRLLLVLVLLCGCSRTVKEASEIDAHAATKIDALEAIRAASSMAEHSFEVTKAAPIHVHVVEAWDEPTPTPADPGKVTHHPKVTDIEQGPVETSKTRDVKEQASQDLQKVAHLDEQKDLHGTNASEKDTEVGPPRWMIGLAIVLVALIITFAAVIYLRWIGKKAGAVADIVLPKEPQ
jgi:hypothetical protein